MAGYTSDEGDNFEEWTTSKRKVNHKTRQVETRVSRQLLVENGKVIADSGPQVTTRIKEDNKVEECEKEKTPKNKSKFEALEMAPEGPEGSCLGRVLGEKKEIQRVSREVREENMQYHDERFKELSGRDVHQKAIKAPHELITINDKHHSSESAPRGKMVHYSNKGKKYKDTDEILEVAKLAIDGSITKEVKRTHNHEEFSEDEKPDEAGEAEELRQKPIVQRSSRRHVDYVNDYDDLRTPDASDNDEREEYDSRGRPIARTSAGRLTSGSRRPGSGTKHRTQHHDDGDDEAFPRYDLDPLLNSLRDEDFKPAGSRPTGSSSPAPATARPYVREHSLERRRQHHAEESSDDDTTIRRARTHQRQQSPASSGRVEIPEEYRVNKQRLMTGRKSAGSRERVHSPVRSVSRGSHSKQQHGRNQQRKEDAAVQAHLTDEEIERQSIRSSLSGGAKTHAKTTQHLQRQSTPNASRRYYYGNAATANGKATRRRNSITSSSSASSLASLDDQQRARQRQQGTRSRDSGFRSPQSTRTETPLSEHKHREQQIYSVSSKSKSTHNNQNRHESGAKSPTLTTGSAGQRSVKTTTTTLAAGLADRPLSRSSTNDKRRQEKSRQANRLANDNDDDDEHNENNALNHNHDDHYDEHVSFAKRSRNLSEARSLDTISVTSLNGPNATKIKVPYRHVIEIQTGGPASVESQRRRMTTSESNLGHRNETANVASNSNAVEKSSSEMSFQTDIESLSKRLASISRPLEDQTVEHFDYKTVETNIQSKPSKAEARQVIGVYNARLEQNSPFLQHQQILVKHNSGQELTNDTHNINVDFTPNEYYIKYRATPALVNDSTLLTGNKMNLDGDDDDRLSQISSCSLQSSRTYKIRTIGSNGSGVRDQTQTGGREQSLNRLNHNETTGDDQNQDNNVEFDENGNSKRPAAWIYDPRDGSSTAIVPPARPKRPETPKVETEELVQSRGGRSYYLEIVDGPKEAAAKPTLNTATAKPKMATSMDSIYSRWNSQGALNTSSSANLNSKPTFSYKPLTSANNSKSKAPQSLYRSTKQLNSAIAQLEQNRNKFNQEQQSTRRQLPFGGAPSSLGDKSKSSSCLLTVTKPSKYSIYGGFRKPGENSKPVPRLSYSRAIGPRSQRVDGLPKTPSRYLKMR